MAKARFQGQTVAVTGAAGFIGGALCRALVAAGAEVIGIAPAGGTRIAAAGARPVSCDVTDRQAIMGALEGADLVVHAAACVHEWGSMEDFVRVNVGGTAAVLDAAERAGARRCLQISSVVVYGFDHRGEQDESAFVRACGIPYIDTKSASDRLARARGAVVIRPGDVYGPRSTQWVLRPLEMARVGLLSLPAKPDGLMLPAYVDDVVEAVLCGLERGEPGQAYAAWEGVPVTFMEHFAAIAALAGKPPPRRLPRPLLRLAGAAIEASARLRGTDPAFTARAVTFVDRRGTVSTQRARRELGWEPRVPHAEGIRRVGAWLRAERPA